MICQKLGLHGTPLLVALNHTLNNEWLSKDGKSFFNVLSHMDKVIQSVEKLISRETLGVHMFNLSCDKIEHMHTHGLHCEIKQCKNFVRCAQLELQKLSNRVQKIFSQT